MKNLVSFFSFFGLIFVFGLSAFAQIPSKNDDQTFEVRLPVTVYRGKNEKKTFLTGLNKGDFTVLEDGVPQEITFFSDEKNNPPVYVGVLMDTSPSTAGKLKFEKESAKNFLYTVLRQRKDKGAFMTFDHEVNLIQDFTDKQDLIDRAIESVKKAGSQTALYDAVWEFSDQKMRTAPGRRVIVIITDGEDTWSRADLNDAISIAQRTETTIFAISTKAGFSGTLPGVEAGTVKDRGDKDLEKLCEETGGVAYFTGDQLALERAFKKISEELRQQYILTYRPANQNYNGEKRKIEVRVSSPLYTKEYRLDYKKGYNATKESLKQ